MALGVFLVMLGPFLQSGVHWFAHKHVDGHIWCLDSLREPRQVSYNDYRQSLAQPLPWRNQTRIAQLMSS